MATPTRLRRCALALVLVGVFALAGCHSGTPAAKRPFAAYRQCLLQHGVQPRGRKGASSTTVTTGAGTTTTSPDPAAFAAARQSCRKLRPAGGLRTGGFGSGPRAAFRKCMTEHGVTLPTEPPGAGTTSTTAPAKGATTTASGPEAPSRGGMLAGLNRNDPAVSAALSACRSLLGAGSTTTTGK